MHRPSLVRRLAAGLVCLLAAGTVTSTASAAPAGVAGGLCGAELGTPRYVAYVYLTTFDRCPDPSGAAFWEGRLDAGLDRWTFAEHLARSNEFVHTVVRFLYDFTLEREPTPAELEAGAAEIRTTRRYDELAADVTSSDELMSIQYSDVTKDEADDLWVEHAFSFFLNRPIDPSGFAYWSSFFGTDGSDAAERREVAMRLQRTAESARMWTRSTYSSTLHRDADPSGLTYWTGWLQGRGAWRTFLMFTYFESTPEAYRLSQREAVLAAFESQRRAVPLPSEEEQAWGR